MPKHGIDTAVRVGRYETEGWRIRSDVDLDAPLIQKPVALQDLGARIRDILDQSRSWEAR